MPLVTTSSGQRLLLIWRTETLFYTAQRRKLAEEWNQVRFTSESIAEQPRVINHALDRPLPLADESFDGIYSFHVIEHLNLAANERFIRDIHRLLKPGATYRASTPDLEFFATEYLKRLNQQKSSASPQNYARYHWAVCNLIDQCVRDVSGGEMLETIRRGDVIQEHLKQLDGDSLDSTVEWVSRRAATSATEARRGNPAALLRKVARVIRRRLLPSAPAKSYMELTHEKNLWLWDCVSLGRLFSNAGFRNISPADHRTSRIPDWKRYNFDQSAFGDYPLEPSLYMEGTK
jgi:predicted SAM-dependent methyltransferase